MAVFSAAAAALWLGILTSISPCPLAANIAAVSLISRKINHPVMVVVSGAAYTAGRMTAYALVGWIIIISILSIPHTAQLLQRYMHRALGPVLVLSGVFILGLIKIRLPSGFLSNEHCCRLLGSGAPGAFFLGMILALAFCPVSAALFFGSLMPLSLSSKTGIFLPLVFGVGTGLPVFTFAVAAAFGVTSLSKWMHRLTAVEHYARRITGGIFILAGFYYIIGYISAARLVSSP